MEKCPLQLLTEWTLRARPDGGRGHGTESLLPTPSPPHLQLTHRAMQRWQKHQLQVTPHSPDALFVFADSVVPVGCLPLQEPGSPGCVVGSPSEPLSPLEEMLSHTVWWLLMARSSAHKTPAARLGSSHPLFLENQMTVPEFLRKWDDLQ